MGGQFFAMASPLSERPNGAIQPVYVGVIILAISVLILGVALVHAGVYQYHVG